MTRTLASVAADVASAVYDQLKAQRRYLAAAERNAIAEGAAAAALSSLIEMTGGDRHIVQSDGGTFTLQHPLAERLTGDLFACDLHRRVADGDPLKPGFYQVMWSDALGLTLEPLETTS